MNCNQIEEQMPAYLDGDLPDSEMENLEEHFHACSHCQQELEKLEKTWSLLEVWQPVEPSPIFRAMVWEKIRQRPVPVSSFRALLRGLKLGMSSMAAACLVVGLTWAAALPGPADGDAGQPIPQSATLKSIDAAENLASDLPLGEVELFEDPGEPEDSASAPYDDSMPVGHMSHHLLDHVHEALQATLEDS